LNPIKLGFGQIKNGSKNTVIWHFDGTHNLSLTRLLFIQFINGFYETLVLLDAKSRFTPATFAENDNTSIISFPL
jgi:hypothetical protein